LHLDCDNVGTLAVRHYGETGGVNCALS